MEQEPTNLPAQIAEAIVSIPKGLVPGVVKALDRLVGATVDIPVAWLQQKKAKIDAQTESYKLVEAGIAKSAASAAGEDPEVAQRAMSALVRKEYRKQTNREAVATAMVEDMRDYVAQATVGGEVPVPDGQLDEDWLNVFERFAEDASSERLQDLWGRVLAGEIRRPGRFSTRTLRFLSEFSQADALTFEEFTKCAFGDNAPRKAVIPSEEANISHLVYLESSGLLQGATGFGLQKNFKFDRAGHAFLREGNLVIILKGEPETKFSYNAIVLTPLGQEVLCLVGGRKPREAARNVAHAIRTPQIHEAHLGVVPDSGFNGRINLMEVLWLKENPEAQSIDGAAV